MNGKRVPTCGTKVRTLLTLTALSLVAAACDPGAAVGPQTSKVRILLTDAPSDMLASADVWISRVYLQGGGGEEPDTAATDSVGTAADRVDLFNDPANPQSYDLLELRDGTTVDLTGLMEVDAGTYQGLRFVVDSARVTLADGYSFEDGSTVGVLKIPSGQQTGIKVKLSDVLTADVAEQTEVVVDFDVDANFHIQTNPQTGLVKKVLFTPVLKEKNRATAPDLM